MKKLHLDPEELQIESFPTMHLPDDRGTVQAHETNYDQCYSQGATCVNCDTPPSYMCTPACPSDTWHQAATSDWCTADFSCIICDQQIN